MMQISFFKLASTSNENVLNINIYCIQQYVHNAICSYRYVLLL